MQQTIVKNINTVELVSTNNFENEKKFTVLAPFSWNFLKQMFLAIPLQESFAFSLSNMYNAFLKKNT